MLHTVHDSAWQKIDNIHLRPRRAEKSLTRHHTSLWDLAYPSSHQALRPRLPVITPGCAGQIKQYVVFFLWVYHRQRTTDAVAQFFGSGLTQLLVSVHNAIASIGTRCKKMTPTRHADTNSAMALHVLSPVSSTKYWWFTDIFFPKLGNCTI